MLHSLGESVGSLSLRAFNWFIFLLRIGRRKLGPRMMQTSALELSELYWIVPGYYSWTWGSLG